MELLVVIGIIGLLMGLLLPAISKAKAGARAATCKNRLHQMGLALQMYVDDHEGRYPYYRSLPDSAFDSAVGADNTGFWWAKLLPYDPTKWTNQLYHCPGYGGPIMGSIVTKTGWTSPWAATLTTRLELGGVSPPILSGQTAHSGLWAGGLTGHRPRGRKLA